MNRKYIRWIAWTVASPFLLFIVLGILIYLPPIQNVLVDKAAQSASSALGMEIKVGRIALSFPLNLVVTDVEAIDQKDTLLQLKRLLVDVELLPLLKKEVEIEGISIQEAQLNSGDFIPGMQVAGHIGELFIRSRGVKLDPQQATINQLLLKNSQINLCMTDSVPADTTQSDTLFWKLLLTKMEIENVGFTMQMPTDSLTVALHLQSAALNEGAIDLHQSAYSLQQLLIKEGEVKMDQGALPLVELSTNNPPFDAAHIGLTGINIAIESLYYKERDIRATIRQFALKEQSGLELVSLTGQLTSNGKVIDLSKLKAETHSSFLELDASLDWSVLAGDKEGWITARLMADIAKPDVMLFMGDMEEEFVQQYPSEPFRIRGGVDGTLQQLKLTNLQATMPTAFELSLKGELTHLVDSIQRGGAIKLEAVTENLDFIETLAGGVNIPAGTQLSGNFSLKGNEMVTDLILAQPHTNNYKQLDTLLIYAGNDSISLRKEFKMEHAARLVAAYNMASTAYQVEVAINELDLNQYLPNDSLYTLSLYVEGKGKGVDPLLPSTTLQLKGELARFRFGTYDLSGILLQATKEQEEAKLTLSAKNREMDLGAQLDATLNHKGVKAVANIDVKMMDWDALQLSTTNLNTSHQLTAQVESDLKSTHSLQASLRKNRILTDRRTIETKDLDAGFQTDKDTVTAYMRAGDLNLTFSASGGVDRLTTQLNRWMNKAMEQWNRKEVNQAALKELYPIMDIKVSAGTQNPIYNILSMNGVNYDNLFLELATSPHSGIHGEGKLKGLRTDSVALDTISLQITQEMEVLRLASSVVSAAKPKQEAFEVKLDGELEANHLKLLLQHLNARKEKGVYLGVAAALEKEGTRLSLFPNEPTIIYRPFTLNENNFVFLSNKGEIDGDIQLYDKEGSGLHLFSSRQDSTALHDISLGLYKIDFKEFRRVMPYLPNIEGVLGLNAHYVATKENLTVSADIEVENFKYEGSELGSWELSTVYLPREDKGHSVDGYLLHNNQEVAKMGGIYLPEKGGAGGLHAGVALKNFPMDIANPFIPEKLAELSGYLNGTLVAQGSPLTPKLNGDVKFDSVAVYLPDYSANFSFDNRPIKMVDSKMEFNNFSIYTKGESPFTVNGNVDLTNFEQIKVDLKLNAANYELLNAPKSKRAIAFGKVYVDFNATVRGPVEELTMRGNMNLLGKTDVTYVMTDAPLTVNDRLNDLVEFVNFSDTVTYQGAQAPTVSIKGIDIAMTINIDQAAQAQVHLTPDGSNYVQLEGGGNLSFQYTPRGEMLLYGRYALMSGEMKYQIPVIPLKTFKVLSGSYVEWTGNPMNPTMNITATETVRASVAEEGKASRMVSFNTGVQITQRLESPGLNFVLSAPEDAALQDKLSALSAEERGKMAVTMLVTGMYIGEGSSSGSFNTNSALNSFLQSEISNIAGKALDINLGMESVNDESGGGKRTDYNFQFARRFWNNRFRIVVGGTVSTGQAASQGESFIDNIAIEYRLDQSGTRNIKLFHEKNYESILEGEIIETGVGLVLHRKMSKLEELFIFKRKK
ncbi:MAG: translocation/assembly module TamB domain-containing protein [Phocaeicola sp.]